MLVSDVIRQASSRFGDSELSLAKELDYIDWINSAQLELSRTTNFLQAYKFMPWAISLYAGGFNLPDDCIAVNRVVYDSRPLVKTELTQLDKLGTSNSTAQADPLYFYISGRLFFLYPNAQTDNLKLEMWYAQAPPVVSVPSDSLVVPIASQEAVITYCLMRAREKNEDFQGQKLSQAEWIALRNEGQFDADNPTSSYPVIREHDASVSSPYGYRDW